MGYDIDKKDNVEYVAAWSEYSEIKLPEYISKIEDAKNKAFEQYREDFLSKLQLNIRKAEKQIKQLNENLRNNSFGEDTYRFRVTPKEEYKRFYQMITDQLLVLGGYNLASDDFNEKYSVEIEELFALITDSGEDYERRVREFTNYRTYLSFDLEVIGKDGQTQRLSKTLGKKSGGETQTPFYIAVLASFAQIYRFNRDKEPNTIRIIIFDEAFSKMDSERISQSIQLLRKFKFQVVLSAPADKIPDIAELVDCNLGVVRKGNQTLVLPFSYNREGDLIV